MENTISYSPGCDAALKRAQFGNPPWGFCPPETCNDVSAYFHQFCNCLGQFNRPPFIQNGICINTPDTLIPIAEKECFCCCCCVSDSMRIMTSSSEARTAREIAVDDVVLTATDKSLKNWVQVPVKFSAGTGSGTANKLIKVYYGDASKGIHVTPKSFVSATISKEMSAGIFNALSVPPNDYIHKNGIVNLDIVRNSDTFVLTELLQLPKQDVEMIHALLCTDPNYLLVTSGQHFLLPDQSFKAASRLIPGKDQLVRADGSSTPVYAIAAGLFDKEVHRIATSAGPASSPDHHLILANGIVIADYALELQLGLEDGQKQESILSQGLELVDATVQQASSAHRSVIAIRFNLAIDPGTALYPGNYLLTPEAMCYTATADENNPKIVYLEAAIAAQTDYTVTVSDLRSSDQQSLVTGKNISKLSPK